MHPTIVLALSKVKAAWGSNHTELLLAGGAALFLLGVFAWVVIWVAGFAVQRYLQRRKGDYKFGLADALHVRFELADGLREDGEIHVAGIQSMTMLRLRIGEVRGVWCPRRQSL